MSNTTEVGKVKESLAAGYLLQKSYQLLAQNYRFKKGEIDLIMSVDSILVFIEVKFRKNNKFGFPETFVSDTKAELIRTTAEHYILEQNWKGRIRFDILAICGEEILHLEDAF